MNKKQYAVLTVVAVAGCANNNEESSMGNFIIKYHEKIQYGQFSHFLEAGIKHAVSTRSILNLGLHTGDNNENVIKNRKKFCEAIKIPFENLVTAQQVHSDNIAIVTKRDAGKGAITYNTAIKETDALVTKDRDLPLMMFFADCVPVLIADPINQVIAIVHAGWKGTVLKIAQKTVAAMKKHYKTTASSCLVGIGPSIGQCCYEVDDAVIKELKKSIDCWQEFVKPHGDKYLLDLWAVNFWQLKTAGVLPENIVISNMCTSCNNDLFFSYRKEQGKTGRIGVVISLEPAAQL